MTLGVQSVPNWLLWLLLVFCPNLKGTDEQYSAHLIGDVDRDPPSEDCKIWVRRDKVICLSCVVSVKSIITAVICSLARAGAALQKKKSVNFSLTAKKQKNIPLEENASVWNFWCHYLKNLLLDLLLFSSPLVVDTNKVVWIKAAPFSFHGSSNLNFHTERFINYTYFKQRPFFFFNKPSVVEASGCRRSSVSCTRSSDETTAADVYAKMHFQLSQSNGWQLWCNAEDLTRVFTNKAGLSLVGCAE